MKIDFRCPYCNQWEAKHRFKDHMWDHMIQGDDVGTIKCPTTYEEYYKRFAPLGLFEQREANE
jgi:hypothetical protein